MKLKNGVPLGVPMAKANIQNLDAAERDMAAEKAAFVADVKAAVESDAENSHEVMAGVIHDKMTAIGEAVLAEAKGEALDQRTVTARGNRALTGEEQAYYAKIGAAMKGANQSAALKEIDLVMPKTIIDAVFDELTEAFPLLRAITFRNTGAQIEIYTAETEGKAVWGDLTAAITAELEATFAAEKLGLLKLSAFMQVFNPILDLGPVWIDRFVRTVMLNAVAEGVVNAIVDGDGNGKPLGMTRQLTSGAGGVHARKTAVPLAAIDPESIGKILETVSKGRNGKRRPVSRLIMVVNPKDYFTRVYPNVTPRAADGTFTQNAMPYPIDVIPSAAMPEGYAVLGLAEKYFMGMGTGSEGRLEYSDEFRFLQHQRVYRIFLYGNGKPMDENAFVYCDIRNLQPAALNVRVESLPTV